MRYLKQVNILLVEDDAADAELAKRGFAEAKVDITVHHVVNGDQALGFLHKGPGFELAATVQFVLLDLNLPGKNGHEVLAEIRNEKKFARLPIVVLSTSQSRMDIEKAYQLGANAYMNKPMDFDEFVDHVKKLADYWFGVVKIPA